MDGQSLPRRGLHGFGLNIERLSHFAGASWFQESVARDVGDNLKFLAVGIGLDAGVEMSTRSQLNVKSASKKESPQRQRPPQARAS